jgi:hypothetical protein
MTMGSISDIEKRKPKLVKEDGSVESDIEWMRRMQEEQMRRNGCIWNPVTRNFENVIRLGEVDDDSNVINNACRSGRRV